MTGLRLPADIALGDPALLRTASYLLGYPFHERLYPGALETIASLRRVAPVVVLSDGDAVQQPVAVGALAVQARQQFAPVADRPFERVLERLRHHEPDGLFGCSMIS